METYGGNKVQKLDSNFSGEVLLGSGPYTYKLHVLENGDRLELEGFVSVTVFVKDAEDNTRMLVNHNEDMLGYNDAAQFEVRMPTLEVDGGKMTVLVAGVQEGSPFAGFDGQSEKMKITRDGDHYKVEKPWGHELWLNGEHPSYAIKEIFLKAGNRTSLQYHNQKQETNVLFSGTTKLVYKANDKMKNDDVMTADLGDVELSAVASIDVEPPVLHRLEAVTDILLYETSTPHLDDVVRVHDDAGRGTGRIQSEHAATRVA